MVQNLRDKETIIRELSSGICKIVFKKKTNGRFRSVYGTLNKNKIPGRYQDTLKNIFENYKEFQIIPVYDIREQAWKSFYIDNLKYFMTEEQFKTTSNHSNNIRGESR